MGKRYDRSKGGFSKLTTASIDFKSMLMILMLEAVTFILMVIYSRGKEFLPLTLLLMFFTIVGYLIVSFTDARKTVFIFSIALTNLGFMVQFIELSEKFNIGTFFLKEVAAIVVMCLAFFFYPLLSYWLRRRYVIIGMSLVQYVICIMMWRFGKVVGEKGGQWAKNSIANLTLFEVVKVLYIFIAAAFLCCNSDEEIQSLTLRQLIRAFFLLPVELLKLLLRLLKQLLTLLKLFLTFFSEMLLHPLMLLMKICLKLKNICLKLGGFYRWVKHPVSDKKTRIYGIHSSTLHLFVHTAILSVFFVLCSELGTLLVIIVTYLIASWIYSRDRKTVYMMIILFITAFGLFWAASPGMVADYPKTEQVALPAFIYKLKLNDQFEKLALRFGYALHPEKNFFGKGLQGSLGLCAIALGGIWGIVSERYRVSAGWFSLFGADNDFFFANIVQTGGFIMGILVIAMFIGLLFAAVHVAEKCRNFYRKGVVAFIAILISVEAFIHIGYNVAMLPITGIPLYFCSSGFTALCTGMAMSGVLLASSTARVEKMR